ncbi:MAG: hypothetical protein ACHQK9_13735 [Reyranellales bacterium]
MISTSYATVAFYCASGACEELTAIAHEQACFRIDQMKSTARKTLKHLVALFPGRRGFIVVIVTLYVLTGCRALENERFLHLS